MKQSPLVPKEIVGVLVNLRSLYNVGSVFRTADGLGISKLYLVGTTSHPHPDEPWRKDHLALAKTALGAERSVGWKKAAEPKTLINRLRREGYAIVALEQTSTSQPITSWQHPNQPIAVLLGNEVSGLSLKVLKMADHVFHIPMHGAKESLNVATAWAIAAFWLMHGQTNAAGYQSKNR